MHQIRLQIDLHFVKIFMSKHKWNFIAWLHFALHFVYEHLHCYSCPLLD